MPQQQQPHPRLPFHHNSHHQYRTKHLPQHHHYQSKGKIEGIARTTYLPRRGRVHLDCWFVVVVVVVGSEAVAVAPRWRMVERKRKGSER
jgi:hypothetical protein